MLNEGQRQDAQRRKEKARVLSDQIKAIKEQINSAQNDLVSKERQLETLYRQCNHRWSEPIYTPIRTEGYRTEGDPPGTMGIDWRGPMYVPPTTTDRWTRECTECGKQETTERKQEKKSYEPDFG
jgi:hypothetical protein